MEEQFDADRLAALLRDPRGTTELAASEVTRLLHSLSVLFAALAARGMPGGSQPMVSASPAHVDGSEGSEEYISLAELARRIPYQEGSIRNLMSQGHLKLGIHYVKPHGRVMFRWGAVRAWLDGRASEEL